MKKIPRFLICENPLLEERITFILTTRGGEMLLRVIDHPDKTFSLAVEKIYQATEKQIHYTLIDARKWYIAARHK